MIQLAKKSLFIQLFLYSIFIIFGLNNILSYFYGDKSFYVIVVISASALVLIGGILLYFLVKTDEFYYYPKTVNTIFQGLLFSYVIVMILNMFIKIESAKLLLTIIFSSALTLIGLLGIIFILYLYSIRKKYKY
jgi:hypothetical protein